MSFRLPPNIEEFIELIAANKGTNKTDAIKEILKLAMDSDLFKKMADNTNRFEQIEKNKCPACVCLEDGFFCVINAPQQKKLGDGHAQDAGKVCQGCNDVKHIKEKLELLQKEAQKTIVFRYPKCKAGGLITELGETEDKQVFDRCPRSRFANCKVKYCKSVNCENLTYREVEGKRNAA